MTRGGLLPIALLAALVAPPSLAQEPDRTALNGVIDLVRLVDLCAECLDLKDAVDALKVVVSGPAAQVTAIPSSNLLLIADLRPRVEQALELLEVIDVPGAGVTVDVVPTETVSAAAVVSAVNDVARPHVRARFGGKVRLWSGAPGREEDPAALKMSPLRYCKVLRSYLLRTCGGALPSCMSCVSC